MSESTVDATINRALGYPYAAPDHSYLFSGGLAHRLTVGGLDPIADGRIIASSREITVARHLATAGLAAEAERPRVPVIGYGSNRAPVQIARKFASRPDWAIPVTRARIRDFDVVWSPQFSGYGAIGATLAPSPGTVAEVAVTWLTETQLAVMHESEGISRGVYAYGRLEPVALELDGGSALAAAYVYRMTRGVLALDGRPVACATIAAEKRRFPALDQRAVQRALAERLAPETPLERFVLETVGDAGIRSARTAALSAWAQDIAWPGFALILGAEEGSR